MLNEYPKLSLLVGLKNNYDYTLNFYKTTRALYPTVEIVFVSYGSSDGTVDFLKKVEEYDPYSKVFYSDEHKTFSDTYNKAIEISTGEFVVFMHNDIILAPNFLENLQRRFDDDTVVSYTTIEPPIFEDHERPGKYIADCGTDLTTYDHNLFLDKATQIYRDETIPGAGFFCMVSKIVLDDIGGYDNLFNPMFCEDDDFMKRLDLYGVRKITALDAICYHFVSKTSRFSDEYRDKTKSIEQLSIRNKLRKWGPSSKKFNVSLRIIADPNNEQLLSDYLLLLEPYFDKIYYDVADDNFIKEYIEIYQHTTKFDLSKKFSYLESKDDEILIEFALKYLNDESYQLFHKIFDTFSNAGAREGVYEWAPFKVTIINEARDHTFDYLKLDSEYYNSKLL